MCFLGLDHQGQDLPIGPYLKDLSLFWGGGGCCLLVSVKRSWGLLETMRKQSSGLIDERACWEGGAPPSSPQILPDSSGGLINH